MPSVRPYLGLCPFKQKKLKRLSKGRNPFKFGAIIGRFSTESQTKPSKKYRKEFFLYGDLVSDLSFLLNARGQK
jgi:hypothetical protein